MDGALDRPADVPPCNAPLPQALDRKDGRSCPLTVFDHLNRPAYERTDTAHQIPSTRYPSSRPLPASGPDHRRPGIVAVRLSLTDLNFTGGISLNSSRYLPYRQMTVPGLPVYQYIQPARRSGHGIPSSEGAVQVRHRMPPLSPPTTSQVPVPAIPPVRGSGREAGPGSRDRDPVAGHHIAPGARGRWRALARRRTPPLGDPEPQVPPGAGEITKGSPALSKVFEEPDNPGHVDPATLSRGTRADRHATTIAGMQQPWTTDRI
jgi:hypothetical protein